MPLGMENQVEINKTLKDEKTPHKIFTSTTLNCMYGSLMQSI